MTAEEELFINQINEKQIQGFRKLFSELYCSLTYFAWNYVERREVAEDIVQEILANVWESPKSYPSYNSLKTFLYTSIRNACLDYCRHKKVEERYLKYSEPASAEGEDLELKIVEEELYRLLLKIVEELPGRCREVFKLHMAGLKNEDIAEQLNLSVLTVKTQKKKGYGLFEKTRRWCDFFAFIYLVGMIFLNLKYLFFSSITFYNKTNKWKSLIIG